MADYDKELMHVLIVDDEPMMRRALAREIRVAHPNCRFIEAGSGEEALRMLDAGMFFNIFVSDNSMPGMRGTEFLREVQKRLPRSIRILVTSDQLKPAEMAAAVGSGLLSAYFSKPWHGEIFQAMIQRVVRKIVDQETVRPPPEGHLPIDYHDDDEPDDEPDPDEEFGDED